MDNNDYITGHGTPDGRNARATVYHSEHYLDDAYNYDFLESLVPGERYILVGRATVANLKDIEYLTYLLT